METAIKTKLVVGADAIAKKIGEVASLGKKYDTLVQVTGMSVLAHIEEHSNVTLLTDLFSVLSKGTRKKAFMDWALKYGKVLANMNDKGQIDQEKPFLFNRKGKTDLLGAEAEPWFQCAPEKLEVPLDFLKMLDSLLKKGDKAKDGVGFTDPAHAALLKAVTEARNSVKIEATAVEA